MYNFEKKIYETPEAFLIEMSEEDIMETSSPFYGDGDDLDSEEDGWASILKSRKSKK